MQINNNSNSYILTSPRPMGASDANMLDTISKIKQDNNMINSANTGVYLRTEGVGKIIDIKV